MPVHILHTLSRLRFMGEPGEEIAQLQRPDKPMRPHKHTSALGVLRLVPNSFASQDVAVARRPTVYVKLRIHRTVRLPGSECAMAGKVWPRSHVVPDRTAQSSSKRVGRESEAEPNHGLFVCTVSGRKTPTGTLNERTNERTNSASHGPSERPIDRSRSIRLLASSDCEESCRGMEDGRGIKLPRFRRAAKEDPRAQSRRTHVRYTSNISSTNPSPQLCPSPSDEHCTEPDRRKCGNRSRQGRAGRGRAGQGRAGPACLPACLLAFVCADGAAEVTRCVGR